MSAHCLLLRMESKSFFLFLIVVTVIVTTTKAQVQFPGKCKNLSVVQSFDLQKYLGQWYEVEKYPAAFETGGRCVYATYSLNPNGTIQVRNARIINETGEYSQIIGSARQEDPSKKEAKLLVTFPTGPTQREGKYWVLDTDYDYYSIVWSCTEVGANNIQFLWYLSRARNPDDDERSNARSFMQKQTLDITNLVPTDQSRCPNPLTII